MAANDYHDFNPSPTVWVLLLGGVVLFVLALSVMFIYYVDRGQVSGPRAGADPEPLRPELPDSTVGPRLTDRRSA